MTDFLKKIALGLYFLSLSLLSTIPLSGLSIPLNEHTFIGLRYDWWLHALVFIPLAPMWRLVWRHHALWLVLLISLLVSFMAEGLHYILPYRSYDTTDMLANMAGAMIGWLVVFKK